jgi:deoxycytidine triphosphate deaminase
MTIKSDKWIKRMAQEHGMISPFEANQVRSVNGEKIISYGVSSYGYDVRCAREFKVFTNVYSATVDPKNFDEKSFVDIVDDVCIIPPNSFALARTVELFKIPRNVLTICLGKSTYARCFRGDTRVALVDGTAPTLEEMAKRAEQGELFWGYSIGENGRLIVSLLDAPRYVGRDSLVEVQLDNQKSIFATPDHLFMLRDGQWRAAGELRTGDSLMPLYRQLVRGYEMTYQPLNGHLYPTHRMADEWNLRNGIYSEMPHSHRHHIDFDRLNNNPWNIQRMDASEHIKLHNDISYGADFDPDEHSAAIREALYQRMQDPIWAAEYSQLQSKRAMQFWHEDEYAQARAKLLEMRRNPSESTRQSHRDAMNARYQDAAERAKQGERVRIAWQAATEARRQKQADLAKNINIRHEINADIVKEALHTTGSIRAAARMLDCDRSVFRRFPDVLSQFRGTQAPHNHKVVAVKEVAGTHDVYCVTVPEAGNFALEDGVFVQNCGIIVNVTPLEPEWEGHVTLEFSNTTNLPAKIYANEGVAQMLFFESDEVCETSYKDRGGKYQGQLGVTLPKA